MPAYQSNVPFQARIIAERIILDFGVTKIIACPQVWLFDKLVQSGSGFVITDHANLSTTHATTGPNIDEFGARFYDVSQMYVMGGELRDRIQAKI